MDEQNNCKRKKIESNLNLRDSPFSQVMIKQEMEDIYQVNIKQEIVEEEEPFQIELSENLVAVKPEFEESEIKTEIVELENDRINHIKRENSHSYSVNEDLAIFVLTDFLKTQKIFKIISDHLEGRSEESVRKRYLEIRNKLLHGRPFYILKIDLYCQIEMRTTPRSRKSVFSKKQNSFVLILSASNIALLKCCHELESSCITAKTLRMTYIENSEFGVDVDLLLNSIECQTYDISSKLRKGGVNFHPLNKILKQEKGLNLEDTSHELEAKKGEKVVFNAKEYRAIFALAENIKTYTKGDVNAAKMISNHIVGRDEESIRQFLESNAAFSNLTYTIPISINLHYEKTTPKSPDKEMRQIIKREKPQKENLLDNFLLLVSNGHLTLLKCKHQVCDHDNFKTGPRPIESITMSAKPETPFGIDEEKLFKFLQNLQLHAIGILPKTVQGFRGLMERSSIRFHEHSKSHILNPAFD